MSKKIDIKIATKIARLEAENQALKLRAARAENAADERTEAAAAAAAAPPPAPAAPVISERLAQYRQLKDSNDPHDILRATAMVDRDLYAEIADARKRGV